MNLHPDDAKVVLEKGWGQRHPLARGGWLGRYVPREFIMVYAPRDSTELDVVCRIIEAAAFLGQWRAIRYEGREGHGIGRLSLASIDRFSACTLITTSRSFAAAAYFTTATNIFVGCWERAGAWLAWL